jgi:SpoVK/Ycf46/Vps4 family AAA+-type ATPase
MKLVLLALFAAIAIAISPFLLLAALGYGIVSLIDGRRTVAASVSVAVWGVAVIAVASGGYRTWLLPMLVLPFAVAAAAHAVTLARWYVPCRTVAIALLWSLPPGMAAFRFWPHQRFIGVAVAWLLALAVIGWRLAQAWQDERVHERQRLRGIAYAVTPGRDGDDGHPAGQRSGHSGDGRRDEAPEISVDEAMAELDNMIGLDPVKEQIRSIATSIEAARMRALAGYTTEKPMRHFVLLGPPGTGKTTVARVIAKIFYAFGLLDTPHVTEAQRASLVGEYLGATAIKTNDLVDAALGGALFIDEAYSLVNEGDGQSDRFGNEAVQALLKRAEDDREDLVIILAGYEKQMETFLTSNPGLASRFATRIKFPSYNAAELVQIAESAMERRGDMLDSEARPALWRLFEDVERRRLVDDLGNGRFVRSLVEKAAEARDVRVLADGNHPAAEDLVTIRAPDLGRAFTQLTSRFRGYAETPTLENALAELDALIGLEPVKRQVRAIAAQLQVAAMRERQGLTAQPRTRHFVFTGPPGTGKTTVARILGRVFAALGLLVRPEVIEAHRADLVGEHLGSTAIKTNKLVDSALGGVLFVDEAYALHNTGYAGGDAFGAEAIQTLLKRAEDDRDRLVVVLAGYTGPMNAFLASNPGLASRFSIRVAFPSYSGAELREITVHIAREAGDSFDAAALAELDHICGYVSAEGWTDDLGNGRFSRSLFERACAHRDVRVSRLGEDATAAELTTVTGDDLRTAYQELRGDAAVWRPVEP